MEALSIELDRKGYSICNGKGYSIFNMCLHVKGSTYTRVNMLIEIDWTKGINIQHDANVQHGTLTCHVNNDTNLIEN